MESHRTVTLDDRKKELRSLLDQVQAHPERDWSTARERIAVLGHMIALAEKEPAAV